MALVFGLLLVGQPGEAKLFQSIQQADQLYGRSIGVPPAWLMGRKELGAVYEAGRISIYCVFGGKQEYRSQKTVCEAVLYQSRVPFPEATVLEILQSNAPPDETWSKTDQGEWLGSSGIHGFLSKDRKTVLVMTDEHFEEIEQPEQRLYSKLQPVSFDEWRYQLEVRNPKDRGSGPPPVSIREEEGVEKEVFSPEIQPLMDMLQTGVVAIATAPLYRVETLPLSGGGPESPVLQGELLARVRTGFLMKAESRPVDNNVGFVGRLLVNLGEVSEVYGLKMHFASVDRDVRERLGSSEGLYPLPEPIKNLTTYPLSSATELLDPLEATEAVLSNARGNILKAYICEPVLRKGNAVRGIVRTPVGYFFGYLRERSSLQNARYTWEQMLKIRDAPYILVPGKKVALRKGMKMMRLAVPERVSQPKDALLDPEEVQILPTHYESILQHGFAGLMNDLVSSSEKGAQLEERSKEKKTIEKGKMERSSYDEMEIQEISLNFELWSEGHTFVEVEQRQRVRRVDMWSGEGMEVNIQPGPWKPVKLLSQKKVENDLDGGCRFTDGKAIYEIRRDGFHAILTQYEVQENPFMKKR